MTIAQLHDIFVQCGYRISTDTRAISGGELFIALRGETFDGNTFALKALEQGAAYSVVCADSEVAKSGDARIIPFPDTLKALQELAAYHREHTLHDGRRIPILGLTGTNGKTTTKELISAVLRTKFNLVSTEGNFNNNIGVPLTVLRLREETEIAVVEMGASHPGDIQELVDIAHPDFGLITNVGRAHLLGFGSFEGVKRTKGELYDYIHAIGGLCFVNADSPDLPGMAAGRTGLKTVEYGLTAQQATVLPADTDHPFLRISLAGDESHAGLSGSETGIPASESQANLPASEIRTNLVGSYNADNVLAAIAIGRYFGIARKDAIAAIEAYVPTNNRSQMVKTAENTLIVDAYNANPSSMAAALENLALIQAEHKAVCLGDMLELGAESLSEHTKVLETLRARI